MTPYNEVKNAKPEIESDKQANEKSAAHPPEPKYADNDANHADDELLSNACASEAIEAIHLKDPKKFMEAMKALTYHLRS